MQHEGQQIDDISYVRNISLKMCRTLYANILRCSACLKLNHHGTPLWLTLFWKLLGLYMHSKFASQAVCFQGALEVRRNVIVLSLFTLPRLV